MDDPTPTYKNTTKYKCTMIHIYILNYCQIIQIQMKGIDPQHQFWFWNHFFEKTSEQ